MVAEELNESRVSFVSFRPSISENLPSGRIDDRVFPVNAFSMFSVSTTSTLAPDKLRENILACLVRLQDEEQLNLVFSEGRGVIMVSYHQNGLESDTRSDLSFPHGDPSVSDTARSADVVFRVTLCRVVLMDMFCVRLKRLSGDTFIYKKIAERLLSFLHL